MACNSCYLRLSVGRGERLVGPTLFIRLDSITLYPFHMPPFLQPLGIDLE